MYNNRTLYYLEQMGITPWIIKNTSSKSGLKLIVLVSASLPKPANDLLKQILASLASEKEQIVLLLKDEADNEPVKMANTSHQESVFWLFFGKELYSKHKQDVIGKSIVVEDLKYLLENPKYKKQVFLDLSVLTSKNTNYDG